MHKATAARSAASPHSDPQAAGERGGGGGASCSYLTLVRERVERPTLSDSSSNSRTPSFGLRGLQ